MTAALPNGEPTVAWQLFHAQWLVSIPQMYLYDQRYLQESGMVTSGNKAIDHQMAIGRRDCYMTIVAMTLYHDEGAPLKLINPKDAIPIYRLLVEHLENWKYILDREVNIGKPPLDDLKKMDALAASIYPVAAQFEDFRPRERGIFEHLANMARRSPISLYSKPKDGEKHESVLDGHKAEEHVARSPNVHTPISDAIARQLFKRSE